jgi:hypothetical protein
MNYKSEVTMPNFKQLRIADAGRLGRTGQLDIGDWRRLMNIVERKASSLFGHN